jgi:hypothetical protein
MGPGKFVSSMEVSNSFGAFIQRYMPAYVEMSADCPQPTTAILILDVSKTLCGTSASCLTYA